MIIKQENLTPVTPSGNEWNFEFNSTTRELMIKSLPYIVSGDNNSNIILIKTPLEYNGVDLYGTNCIISYETKWETATEENIGQVDLTNSCKEFNDYLIYAWVLDSRQTLDMGSLTFSLHFLMNLENDPYQSQARIHLTKSIDNNEKESLELISEEMNDTQKKYWSISSTPVTLDIKNGGNITKGTSFDDLISGVDQEYDPNSRNAQSGTAVAEAVSNYVPIKDTFGAPYELIYAQKGDGVEGVTMLEIDLSRDNNAVEDFPLDNANAVPIRNSNGSLYVPTPNDNSGSMEAANKKYVDDSIPKKISAFVNDAQYIDIAYIRTNYNSKDEMPFIYYTKTEIDDLIGDIETLLGGI